MANSAEKLAESLSELKSLQDQGFIALQTAHLGRVHRERLLKNGFLTEVIKGWYVPTRPDEPAGESTSWYTSFWHFCADYLNSRFGADWCLSPEYSLNIHIGDWTVPKQLLVRSPRGGNKPTALLFDTSIFDMRLDLPAQAEIEVHDDIRIMSLPTALISCAPSQFTLQPLQLRAALSMLNDASGVLRDLLGNGRSVVAGRLAGALRDIGRDALADEVIATMRSAGHTVNASQPFAEERVVTFAPRATSPHVNRLQMSWQAMRTQVVDHFPPAPGIVNNTALYLKDVEEHYVSDAYHSLSIEGYRVSEELIENVRTGAWRPEQSSNDRNHADALAARGYWQAFQAVKQSIEEVLNGGNAGELAERGHRIWYRELFSPSVTAGLMPAAELAGYRNGSVYIRHSKHIPPRNSALPELMIAFFELLQQEPEPAVRVVLGHFFFVYIHPYADGNGRIGRFLMNLMFAAGGYPWTVVPVQKRTEYMAALEAASVEKNIVPFSLFLGGLIGKKFSASDV